MIPSHPIPFRFSFIIPEGLISQMIWSINESCPRKPTHHSVSVLLAFSFVFFLSWKIEMELYLSNFKKWTSKSPPLKFGHISCWIWHLIMLWLLNSCHWKSVKIWEQLNLHILILWCSFNNWQIPVPGLYDGPSFRRHVHGKSFDDSEPYLTNNRLTNRTRGLSDNNVLKSFSVDREKASNVAKIKVVVCYVTSVLVQSLCCLSSYTREKKLNTIPLKDQNHFGFLRNCANFCYHLEAVSFSIIFSWE